MQLSQTRRFQPRNSRKSQTRTRVNNKSLVAIFDRRSLPECTAKRAVKNAAKAPLLCYTAGRIVHSQAGTLQLNWTDWKTTKKQKWSFCASQKPLLYLHLYSIANVIYIDQLKLQPLAPTKTANCHSSAKSCHASRLNVNCQRLKTDQLQLQRSDQPPKCPDIP